MLAAIFLNITKNFLYFAKYNAMRTSFLIFRISRKKCATLAQALVHIVNCACWCVKTQSLCYPDKLHKHISAISFNRVLMYLCPCVTVAYFL